VFQDIVLSFTMLLQVMLKQCLTVFMYESYILYCCVDRQDSRSAFIQESA